VFFQKPSVHSDFRNQENSMLIVKELTASKALDRNAMASVAGGVLKHPPEFPFKSITKEKLYANAAVETAYADNTSYIDIRL
jgi:hypothetical protein